MLGKLQVPGAHHKSESIGFVDQIVPAGLVRGHAPAGPASSKARDVDPKDSVRPSFSKPLPRCIRNLELHHAPPRETAAKFRKKAYHKS